MQILLAITEEQCAGEECRFKEHRFLFSVESQGMVYFDNALIQLEPRY